MLVFAGDFHAEFRYLDKVEDAQQNTGNPIIVVQAGDFGFYPDTMKKWKRFPFPIYFISGNHEWHPSFRGIEQVTEVADNLFYIPRGTVMELEGYKLGFLGGGSSVDQFWQKQTGNWFEDENITQEQADRLLGHTDLDYLVTHTPPYNVIYRNFGPLKTWEWKLPADWKDVSAFQVERIWGELGRPPMICGHMHQSVIDGNCRILDVGEIYSVESKVAHVV